MAKIPPTIHDRAEPPVVFTGSFSESRQVNTVNFSDRLEQEERAKLDELERMAIEALDDDIWIIIH